MRMAAALGLACALAFGPAHARPFTVEDLLSLQDLGRAAFSPDGRWLVLDVQAPWTSASRFDLEAMTFLALGRPMIVEVAGDGAARPLLPFAPGTGYVTGAFSPDGSRILVYRQQDRDLELGVVTLASGQAWWSGLSVEPELFAASARWRDRDTLVVLSHAPADGKALARGWIYQQRATQAWAAAAAGAASGTVLGAGRYRSINPPPPNVRLTVVDLKTGGVRALAEGPFTEMTLSPDAGAVALVEDAALLPPGLEAPSAFKSSRRRRLVLVDFATGRRARPCPDCDLARLPLAWSPDGRQVLAAARRDGDAAAFGYWTLPMAGPARPAAPGLVAADSVGRDPSVIGGAAWLAGAPAVLARPAGAGRLDWWRLTARGPVKLTAGLDAVGPAITATGDALLLQTPAGPARLGADGKTAVLAPATARLIPSAILAGERPGALAVSAAGLTRPIWPAQDPGWPHAIAEHDLVLDVLPRLGLTVTLARDAHGVKSVRLGERSGASRTVLTLNAGLATITAAAPIALTHAGPDGAARTSWLYMPAAPDPTASGAEDIPVIVVPYPGAAYPRAPADAEPGALAFTANVQVLTSAGYAVVAPSLPLAADADPGAGLAAGMLAAVDAARAQRPSLSARRLAVWGQSFGGWGALMAAAQTNRFKAVIATSPITDLFTFYGHLSPQALVAPERYLALPSLYGWSETGQGRMGGPPWRDPARHLRNSPGLLTDRITAPVLLVTSDSDFTSGQSAPVFTALYRQDKDAQLITYGGEGHVVLSPGNVRDLYGRALAFLADALGSPAKDAAPTASIAQRPSQ